MVFLREVLLAVSVSMLVGCGGVSPAPAAAPVVPGGSAAPQPEMKEETPEEGKAKRAKAGQDKAHECNALIGVINKGVEGLTSAASKPSTSTSGTDDYEVMADIMDAVANELSKLEMQDTRLQGFSEEYETMARRVAKSARALIAAAEAGDMAKLNAAKADVNETVQREDPLVDAINKYCHEP